MPRYSVFVFCDECSIPHPMGIAIVLEEALDPTQSIGDLYDGRELPKELANLSNNSTRCPKTGRTIRQRDNHQVFLKRDA